MNGHCLLICVKVALSYAIVEIMVTSDKPADDLLIYYTGYSSNIISDNERGFLELTENRLKNGAEAMFYERPTSVHLCDPTPWGNHFKKYKWPEVHCSLSVINAKYDFTDELVLLNNFTYQVTKSMANGADNMFTLSSREENTIKSQWWGAPMFNSDKKISYSVSIARGQFRFTATNHWGEAQFHKQRITIRATTSTNYGLADGETVYVQLSATRRKLNLSIDYLINLSGVALVNFARQYKGHHFWRCEINNLIRSSSGNHGTAVTGEKIGFSFLVDPILRFTDATSSRLLQEISGVID